MTDTVIRVENLGKKYRLCHQPERRQYSTLRDALAQKTKALFQRREKRNGVASADLTRPGSEDFWALRNICLDVKRGEVMGIIGRNGAGKSTLLKILSRITEPTEGRVQIRGRVASLLEVGTGFHSELTGRENIYLNGAILGMTRLEIKSKFDAIVAFSEVEKFLDTPVKRYSSGMYVRLAFAVAAHLEPEILIVDEVLAVGDAQFQKKCLGKMQQVGRSGRTVLFVSHNMAVIQSLCDSAVLLSQGSTVERGTADEVVAKYVSAASQRTRLTRSGEFPGREPKALPIVQNAELIDEHGAITTSIPVGARIIVRLYLAPPRRISRPVFGIGVDNHLGQRIVSFNSHMNMLLDVDEIESPRVVECAVPSLPLTPGEYRVKLVVREGETDLDVIEDALAFTVQATDWFGTGRLPHSSQGAMVCRAEWALS